MQREAPSGNYWKRLGFVAILGAILVCLCFFIMVISSPSSNTSPTPKTNSQVSAINQGATGTQPIAIEPVSSETITLKPNTLTPTQTETPTMPTATNTPDMLSCIIIESVLNNYREQLTSAQYDLEGGIVDLYIKSLYGKAINFRGAVEDVIIGVFIYDDSCQNRLELSGIPDNESILLNKGTVISGYGTVEVFSTWQIIHIDVKSYQVVK